MYLLDTTGITLFDEFGFQRFIIWLVRTVGEFFYTFQFLRDR